MNIAVFTLAALLLALERVTYWWVWNRPEAFQRQVARHAGRLGPVKALKRLFVVLKVVQVAVLLGWCMWFSGRVLPWPEAPPGALGIGLVLLLSGQVLNAAVFWRLGENGVFYGNRFGRSVEWQHGFPFSLLPHPQYFGALVSVWGFMLLMRYPAPDWLVLPALSTVYYLIGARVER